MLIQSATIFGMTAFPVEVDVKPGIGPSKIIGLPEQTAREVAVRVRSALTMTYPTVKVPTFEATVRCASGHAISGPPLDLPIAIGVLVCAGVLHESEVAGWCVFGELSLAGAIRPVRGAIAVAAMASAAGASGLMCGRRNAGEASLIDGVAVLHGELVADIVTAVQLGVAASVPLPSPPRDHARVMPCMSDVRGQERAKRALEIAAAGGHGILLVGAPGTGKTMLARRLATIMPTMSAGEAIEATTAAAVCGLLHDGQPIRERPFRAPHHTCSNSALVGERKTGRIGELALARHGVLFLDEFAEFGAPIVEALHGRGIPENPLANVLFVAASNHCQCGWHGSHNAPRCACSQATLSLFRRRVLPRLVGVIEMKVEFAHVRAADLRSIAPGETSAAIRERVTTCRAVGAAFEAPRRMTAAAVAAVDAANLQPWQAIAVTRVATTIANLANRREITGDDVDEALSFAPVE